MAQADEEDEETQPLVQRDDLKRVPSAQAADKKEIDGLDDDDDDDDLDLDDAKAKYMDMMGYGLLQQTRDAYAACSEAHLTATIVLNLVATFVLSLGKLLPSYCTARAVSNIRNGHFADNTPLLMGCIVGMLITHLLESYIKWSAQHVLKPAVEETVRVLGWRALVRARYAFLETHEVQTYLVRINKGAAATSLFVQIAVGKGIAYCLICMNAILAMTFFDYRMALFALVVSMLVSKTFAKYKMQSVARRHAAADANEATLSIVDAVFSHLKLVKLQNMEDRALQRVRAASSEAHAAKRRITTWYKRPYLVSNAVNNVISVLIWLWLTYECQYHGLTVAHAVLLSRYFGTFRDAYSSLVGVFPKLIKARIAQARAAAVLDKVRQHQDIEPGVPQWISESWKTIRVTDVTFQYAVRDQDKRNADKVPIPALNHVSLHVTRGEKVAIIGKSGSGKSTILKILMRLYSAPPPSQQRNHATQGFLQGSIQVGDATLAHIPARDLYRRFKIVPQQDEILETSLRDNFVLCSDSKVSDAAIVTALQHAHVWRELEPKLATLQGLDTCMGSRGLRLSGGQAQRVCIARALLTMPEVLLLDEATANLDAVTERKIHKTLSGLECTVVAVTHRVSHLGMFDRIIVMEDGCVVGQGTADELLRQQNVAYAALLGKSNAK